MENRIYSHGLNEVTFNRGSNCSRCLWLGFKNTTKDVETPRASNNERHCHRRIDDTRVRNFVTRASEIWTHKGGCWSWRGRDAARYVGTDESPGFLCWSPAGRQLYQSGCFKGTEPLFLCLFVFVFLYLSVCLSTNTHTQAHTHAYTYTFIIRNWFTQLWRLRSPKIYSWLAGDLGKLMI